MAQSPYRQPASSKPKPLGNHQASWIWGRHLVLETLQARHWPILELLLADDLPAPELAEVTRLAAESEVSIERAARNSLVSRCRGEDHQGYAARMAEFPYATTDALLGRPSPWSLIIVLDRIQDPYNFGTMLRSAEIFDAAGVIIGTREQVGVTSQVARSSVGAVNRLPIARVPDLGAFLGTLSDPSPVIIAASEKAETSISHFDFRQPIVLVIGNEGRGISDEVSAHCRSAVRIPQQGTLNSLNAAAALAIICYEARRQQAARPA